MAIDKTRVTLEEGCSIMSSEPIPAYSDIEWLLLTTPNDPGETEEAPWMTMPDFQWRIITLLMSILRRYARAHGLRWYLAAELKVVMPRRIVPRTLDLGPDLLMAEADDYERRSWQVEQEGGPPLLVLEVVTEESWNRDTVEKPLLYERMGVREYIIFAPERNDTGPTLFGYHRDAEGNWIPWATDAQGLLHSEVLGGLRFHVEGRRLRAQDPLGHILLSDEEAAEQEAARAEREAARAEQEAARADAVEAELRRLRELYGYGE